MVNKDSDLIFGELSLGVFQVNCCHHRCFLLSDSFRKHRFATKNEDIYILRDPFNLDQKKMIEGHIIYFLGTAKYVW